MEVVRAAMRTARTDSTFANTIWLQYALVAH
jgi:hypothetical protein